MLYGYKILVVCTAKIYEDRFCAFISSLNESLKKSGWRIMVFCTESDLYRKNKANDGTRKIFDLINYDIADAIIISDQDIQDKLVKQKIISNAKQKEIPVVIIGNSSSDNYSISYSLNSGFEQVVRHIIEHHNIRNLHFMAGREDSVQSNDRLEIFKEVLIEHDIPFSSEMVSYGDFWDIPTRIATKKLIDSKNIPEAIICANDIMALTVISVLRQNGFDCPDDVLVTGFDGIDQIYYSNPKITTALCDHNLLGQETAKFINEIIDNKLPVCERKVDSSLLINESCGCHPELRADSLDYICYVTNAFNRYRGENVSLSNLSYTIHDCESIEHVTEILSHPLLYNAFVLLKSECLDYTVDPNISHSSTTFGKSMYVCLDSDNKEKPGGYYIKTEELIPRMKDILDYYTYPLIFTALHNIDTPLGYLCFCFCSYDKQNYTKVGQISTWVGTAISGFRNMQYQRQLLKKIEVMYQHDSLTGLLNRNGFTRLYNSVLKDESIENITLAMCDLDNLKFINDNYSHNEGDEAIRIVGKALSESVPKDIEAFFCRYGGDEILGLYLGDVDEQIIKEKVDKYLEDYNLSSCKEYEVSTSIGVYTSKKKSFREMFSEADKLMYNEKIQKKNHRI